MAPMEHAARYRSDDAGIVTIRPATQILTRQSLPNFVGVSARTADAQGICMNLVIIPPGAQAEPHFHDGFETAIYLLKGDVETRYGPGLRRTCINKQGDFLFIPPGVPHQPRNLSDSEPAMAIVARNTANEQESVVLYDPEGDRAIAGEAAGYCRSFAQYSRRFLISRSKPRSGGS